MTFGLGTVFCWVQSYITLKVNLRNEGLRVAVLRFLLSGCVTVCMMLCILSLSMGVSLLSLGCQLLVSSTVILNSPGTDPLLLSQNITVPAARCQWALVTFFLVFLGTFAIEFRHCCFDVTCTESSGRPVGTSETLFELSRSQSNQL